MAAVWFVIAVAMVFGLLAGSFLNVCIVRLPAGESVVSPRSRCVACGRAVRWFDNVPVLSFLVLRGRCRDCRAGIGVRYPLVELGTGLWFAWSFVRPARMLAEGTAGMDAVLPVFVHATGMAVLGFLLIGLMAMDWRDGLLPNEFTLGGLFVGLFLAATESFFLPSVRVKTFFTPEEVFIGQRFGAALGAFLLLWSVGVVYRLVRRRAGMGLGDAKMLAMMGAFLGFGLTGVAFVVGVVLAGLVGVAVLVSRRGGAATKLPFGSFLAVGGMVAAVVGERMVGWYLGLFR